MKAKLVFVVEEHGEPAKHGSEAYATALRDHGWASAWHQLVPVTRPKNQKLVPYVSLETLKEALKERKPYDALVDIIRQATDVDESIQP